MRRFIFLLLATALATSASAQQFPGLDHTGVGATPFAESPNLPTEKIGKDDLIGVSVYDSAELTRTVRVGPDGSIRLPMLKHPVQAAGLLPAELEVSIATALKQDNVLVDPIVTVSVVEYRSRPISVMGAVKKPVTFQAAGTVTLLDALARAEGLTEFAGMEILISRPSPGGAPGDAKLVQRIPIQGLINDADPALNIELQGGEEIRVPEAGKIFVVGRVKKPGAYLITGANDSTVMKALALSEGLDSFSGHKAFIYRTEAGANGRSEIPIELKKIMERKAPDVPLMANDILYIPDQSGMRASLKVLETTIGVGAGVGAAMIYAYR